MSDLIDMDSNNSISQATQDYIKAWNTHDLPLLLTFYAPDFEAKDVGQANPVYGKEGVEQVIRAIFDAFPDLCLTCDDPVVQGERAAIAWIMRGTHHGVVMHIPPTHRSVEVNGISILTLRDGKISRATHVWDLAGLLRNLGLLPDL